MNGVNTSTKLGPRFSTSVANTNHSTDLKEIINNNPEYYLDEIAVELVKKVGVYLPFSTFYKTITKRLKYSLQVCYEAAKQRNEMERRTERENEDGEREEGEIYECDARGRETARKERY